MNGEGRFCVNAAGGGQIQDLILGDQPSNFYGQMSMYAYL